MIYFLLFVIILLSFIVIRVMRQHDPKHYESIEQKDVLLDKRLAEIVKKSEQIRQLALGGVIQNERKH